MKAPPLMDVTSPVKLCVVTRKKGIIKFSWKGSCSSIVEPRRHFVSPIRSDWRRNRSSQRGVDDQGDRVSHHGH